MSGGPPYGGQRTDSYSAGDHGNESQSHYGHGQSPYGQGQPAYGQGQPPYGQGQPPYGQGQEWGGQPQPPHMAGRGLQGAQLTIEEQRVLRDCNRESFWYRSLPLGAVFATLTHAAIARGMLQPSARFGSKPKVIFASIFGYFVGKFSYVDKCADKFLIEAPQSKIAASIRLRRGIAPLETIESAPDDSDQMGGSQAYPSPYLQQESSDAAPPSTAPAAAAPSYEQLRRRNREQGGGPAAPPPAAFAPPQPPPPPPPAYQPSDSPALYRPVSLPKSSNKYGDEGFE